MSHMHIPDGVLPFWLVSAGWIVTLAILYISIRWSSGIKLEQKLPLIGIASALMIVGMTLEIVPIAYHINMSVIAGIVLGPALGFIAVFIVDLIIAMFGHGGITVVGLNTLIVGAEAVLGFYLFRACLSVLRRGGISIGFSSALAALFSLMLSTSLMVGIVHISQINPSEALHNDAQNSGQSTASHEQGYVYKDSNSENQRIDTARFAKTVLFLGIFGWVLEAAITGFVIGYVSRVRPDLIFSKAT